MVRGVSRIPVRSKKSSHWRWSVRKDVLRNFAKFTRKHLCPSQRPWHRCFSVNFEKFLRTTFLQNTSGDFDVCESLGYASDVSSYLRRIPICTVVLMCMCMCVRLCVCTNITFVTITKIMFYVR